MAMAPECATSSIDTDPWAPYSSAGDYYRHVALSLGMLLGDVALILATTLAVAALVGAVIKAVEYFRGRNANITDPENVAPPLPPAVLYSSATASTMLAGATAECAICLAEFADGDAVRVMPACRHGFHALCIERWLAGRRRRSSSSCPTCRAPVAVATAP